MTNATYLSPVPAAVNGKQNFVATATKGYKGVDLVAQSQYNRGPAGAVVNISSADVATLVEVLQGDLSTPQVFTASSVNYNTDAVRFDIEVTVEDKGFLTEMHFVPLGDFAPEPDCIAVWSAFLQDWIAILSNV